MVREVLVDLGEARAYAGISWLPDIGVLALTIDQLPDRNR